MSARIPEWILPLFVLAALCTASPAHALPSDRDQPIHLSADRADINDHTGVSVFTGHVVLTQGSMRLRADILTVYHDRNDKITRMVATGAPVRFRELPKAQGEAITGSARRVDYDVAKDVVVLEQDAELVQGKNRFQGPRIEYDRGAEIVKAGSAGGTGGRVEITLEPKRKGAKPEGGRPGAASPVPGTKPPAGAPAAGTPAPSPRPPGAAPP